MNATYWNSADVTGALTLNVLTNLYSTSNLFTKTSYGTWYQFPSTDPNPTSSSPNSTFYETVLTSQLYAGVASNIVPVLVQGCGYTNEEDFIKNQPGKTPVAQKVEN